MQQIKGMCLISTNPQHVSFSENDICGFLSLLGVADVGLFDCQQTVLAIPVLFHHLNIALFAQKEVHNTKTEFGNMTIVIESSVEPTHFPSSDLFLYGVDSNPIEFNHNNILKNQNVQFFEKNRFDKIQANEFLIRVLSLTTQRIGNLGLLLKSKIEVKQTKNDKPSKKQRNDYINIETQEAIAQVESFLSGMCLTEQGHDTISRRDVYLMIRNINFEKIEISHILYLLGSLTNVDEYLVDYDLDVCFVSFFDGSRLDRIISYLNNQKYFGKQLLVEKVDSGYPLKGIPYF